MIRLHIHLWPEPNSKSPLFANRSLFTGYRAQHFPVNFHTGRSTALPPPSLCWAEKQHETSCSRGFAKESGKRQRDVLHWQNTANACKFSGSMSPALPKQSVFTFWPQVNTLLSFVEYFADNRNTLRGYKQLNIIQVHYVTMKQPFSACNPMQWCANK